MEGEKYTNKHKKLLYKKIASLSKTEHEEILKMLKNFNEKHPSESVCFSKNKNGFFFNLSEVNDILFEELDKFVTFCISNQKDLDDYDKKINECKINNNYNQIIHINLETIHKTNIVNDTVEEADQTHTNEDWTTLALDAKAAQKVATYISKVVQDKDKVGKKKANLKFNNAVKKYSKRVVFDKKIDVSESNNEALTCEDYVITT